MSLSFKNRIALYYMFATAIIMALVFCIIYFVVQNAVFRHLDNDLSYEAQKHTTEVAFAGDSIKFINKAEWEEREHREIQVNPVFIQLMDAKGRLMDKSPNLKGDYLIYNPTATEGHFNAELNKRAIRQVQLLMQENGQAKGYILAAMSSESELSVLESLRNVLFVSYLIVLCGLYFISRFLAGRSIKPVKAITQTITRITSNNLNERVQLPVRHDELYHLSNNFNGLLERIESAIEREKQFTSDASHELRTPLATLRGTLEVLIRKPRSQEEYEAKIEYSLLEVEKMTNTLEQLLVLARLDAKAKKPKETLIPLPALIHEAISSNKALIIEKELKIELNLEEGEAQNVPHYYSSLIINNLLNNAIKYSHRQGIVGVDLSTKNNKLVCTIKDFGLGIRKEDLANVYDNFFRSDSLEHKHIKGNGLGLSIVKKSAKAINAKVEIDSELGQGTTVVITF